MEDYISQLNPQQQDAVLYTDGPALVIAGAGSGKTRVLTYKIVHLLNHGFEPWRILALTFTNKAAREMRERIESLVGPAVASKLWMGTFHSIFSRILRINADRLGFKSNFTIYDANDSKALIKMIIKDLNLDDKIYKPSVVASAISMAKNALISPQKYATSADIIEADRQAKRPRLHEIYRIYNQRCFVSGAMDFDDLLYYTNVLLRDNPDILQHYQEFFRYILVDEYQDTNFAQHLIVSQICQQNHNLCVVGDDAQSIYSFRGANIRNILNLKNSYPDLRIFKLEQNYRSTQNIINAANSLIEKNTEQIRKQVFSCNEVGSRIEVVKAYSDFEESALVASRISQQRLITHDSFDEFAVLYRTNAQSRVLEESLRKRNIPYRIYGGLSFYQRKEIKDAIAYFRLSINPNDDEALKRVINYPARGIGDTTLNKLTRCAIDNQKSIWHIIDNLPSYETGINSGTAKKLGAFRDLILSFNHMNEQGLNADVVADKIICDTQLISVLLSDRTPESVSKQENIAELKAGVKEFVTNKMEEGMTDNLKLTDFLAEVSLATDQDEDQSNGECVTLMTVHAAKGLEFGNIFVVGVEEELFPSSRCETFSEIEEERRLLYVAITRAKTFCMITYASSRYRNGQTVYCSPSRFLRDIDPQYLLIKDSGDLGSTSTRVNPAENYRSSYHTQPRQSQSQSSSSRFGNMQQPTPAQRPSGNFKPLKSSSAPSVQSMHQAEDLNVGMKIEHSRFGTGTITKVDSQSADARIVVQFTNVGEKTLLLKFAKFNIIG